MAKEPGVQKEQRPVPDGSARTRFQKGDANLSRRTRAAKKAAEAAAREKLGLGESGTLPTTVKEAVTTAFQLLGGVEFLKRLGKSRKDRYLFVNLLAKCVPQEQHIGGLKGGPLEAHILTVATQGLSKLSDEKLAKFRELLDEMGASDPLFAGVAAANEAEPEPAAEPEKAVA